MLVSAATAAATAQRTAPRTPAVGISAPVSTYRIVKIHPHDREAFTEGLFFHNGALYESTGLNGKSWIRKIRLETGEVLQQSVLEPQYFGEGIVAWKQSLIQLTYKNEIGFVYDLATMTRRRSFKYPGEGWALTHDGTRIIMSDGTASLRFLDPETLKETGRLLVKDGGKPVVELNELEFVKGEILANVWKTERIARISPKTGQVIGWIDVSGLLDPRDAAGVDVLNGIAYDAAGDRLFVTGKLWPKLYELRIVPPARK
ncbi:MAG: glutaminyl-peptide cyclotransferase [Vicinamibacterales bacterium]